MELKDMNLEQIIERMEAITTELNGEGLTEEMLDSLEAETNSLIERKAQLIEERKADEEAVLSDEITPPIQENIERNLNMENIITRNSPEYINAYADYYKTGDATIVRSLLTENATDGTIAVPEFVENRVRTSWEKSEIWSLVPKTYLKGNYKVMVEASSTGASWHEEGGDPISEEDLVLAIVELVPKYVKKYITISDEAMSLTGEAFLNYILDEIEQKLIEALEAEVVDSIYNYVSTNESANVVPVTTPSAADFINAEGLLQGNIRDLVIIMNRQTRSAYRTIPASDGYFIDAFDGIPVLICNYLPAFSSADEDDCIAIIGSLSEGFHANLPNGANVDFKIDDRSIALTSKDMVAVLGRLFVGMGVVRTGSFVLLTKGEE